MEKNTQKTLHKFEIKDGSRLRKFAIITPTRKLRQDGELYYTAQLSRFISAGILPRALWEKVIKNNGGSVAEPDKKGYADLYKKLVDSSALIEELVAIAVDAQTEEQKAALTEAQVTIVQVRREMQALEADQIALYENTAEAKARNSSIIWWALNLASEANIAGNYYPIIAGETIDEKLDTTDVIAEDDEFLNNVLKRINYLVTIWYIGAANTPEEFVKHDQEFLIREGEILQLPTPEPVVVPAATPVAEEVVDIPVITESTQLPS